MTDRYFKILYEFVSLTFKGYLNVEGQDDNDGIQILKKNINYLRIYQQKKHGISI